MRPFWTLFIVIPIIAYISCINSNAQTTWDGDCVVNDPNDNCMDWGVPEEFNLELGDPDCNAIVTYRKRLCGAQIEILITGLEIIDGCTGWDSKNYFHQKYDGFKEYAILGTLHQMSMVSPVSCTSAIIPTYASVYTAACGIWVCCEYTLPSPVEYTCDPEWIGPAPHYGVNPAKVKSCKWQACGSVCCKRVYSICERLSNEEGHLAQTLEIKLIGKEKLGDCSGETPNFTRPCEDGC